MSNDEPLPVEFDELLASEFDYIAQTAAQATEDRARVSSFYLIAVGSLIAAMFGTQFIGYEISPSDDQPDVQRTLPPVDITGNFHHYAIGTLARGLVRIHAGDEPTQGLHDPGK